MYRSISEITRPDEVSKCPATMLKKNQKQQQQNKQNPTKIKNKTK